MSHTTALGLLLLGVMALPGCAESERPGVETRQVTLRQALSCADLEAMLEEDALAKMNASIDALIAGSQGTGDGWSTPPGFRDEAPAGGGSNGGEDTSTERASDYSDTNTQVTGVDEADIVKNDGNYIYLLHGRELIVVDAWPAASLGQLASFEIEGQPIEMYVAGDDAVVYSTVNGDPIYEAAGVEPRPGYADAIYYGEIAADVTEPAASDAAIYPGPVVHPLTKLTVLRFAGGVPSVVRELYFEGSYLSSRRVGTWVRTVIVGGGHGPSLEYFPAGTSSLQTAEDWRLAYEALRSRNAAAIQSATYADWLPLAFERTSGEVSASHTACDELYVPTAGSTDYGMTSVIGLDAAVPDAPAASTAIMGAVDTVYGSPDGLYLASRSWTDPGPIMMWASSGAGSGGGTGGAAGGGGASPVDAGTVEPTQPGEIIGARQLRQVAPVALNATHLHRFAFDDANRPRYVASGSVPGTVDDQFSIDEHEGLLRVATTEDRVDVETWTTSQMNGIFVLRTSEGGGALETVGRLTDLAPGERIYSARFLGDVGYLVTFRQVDPLFAIDLSDPAAPEVLGELEIPGFSEYMHPLGEGHLLTVGRDEGVALQIFDVTDPAEPRLAHKYVFTGDEWGYTDVETTHKALTYSASRGLVAFPYVAYGTVAPGYRSSLEIFHVDAADGIERLGSIDHSRFFVEDPYGYCGGYFGVQVRRGIFMEDIVYAISYGGITAQATGDLDTSLASLALPPPESEIVPCGRD